MSRFLRSLHGFLPLFLGYLSFLSVTSVGLGDDRPPNILLIVSDDQGWTDFGFMGHEAIQTPNLDRLASESIVFPNAYVPTSLCRASLATLLTGMYGHQHRICCNDPPDGVDRAVMHPFIQKAPAIPRLLGKIGYSSLQTGKFWEGHYLNAGFTHGMTEKGRHGDDGLAIGRTTFKPVDDFLDEVGTKPFFLWYAPMLPHEPHDPPKRILEKYTAPGRPAKLAAYFAMCEWFDETVGTVLKKLDDRGLRDNTLVMFVVDNGWIQETGEVRTTRGWFAPKSKLSPYDGGLRFPLMIRWPGQIKAGRSTTLVSSIDVVPTLLAAAGIPQPNELTGISLLSEARGLAKPKRDAVFGEIFTHTATNIEKPALDLTHRWVRHNDWKLILFEEEGHSAELYNLVDDPYEKINLAQQFPERVADLSQRINAWWGGRATAAIRRNTSGQIAIQGSANPTPFESGTLIGTRLSSQSTVSRGIRPRPLAADLKNGPLDSCDPLDQLKSNVQPGPIGDVIADSDRLQTRLIFSRTGFHSHGSCIVECPNGDLLACWYQGSGERKADDVRVLGSRLRSGQEAWDEPFLLADAPGFPDTNPCLVVDRQNRLWLFWQTIVANEWHTAICRYKVSSDYSSPGVPKWELTDDLLLKPDEHFLAKVEAHANRALADVKQLPADQQPRAIDYLEKRKQHAADKYFVRMGWMTRVHPWIGQVGEMIVPLYSDGFDFSLMAITKDGGKTWHASEPLVSLGGVQPSLARRKDGTLTAWMRDNGPPPKRVLYAESTDLGESWSEVVDTPIPNSGTGVEMIVLQSGNWLLVNNDTETGRHRLSVWLSQDEGKTWPWKRTIEDVPPRPLAATASYPSITQAKNGTIHLTYTHTIKGDKVPLDAAGRPEQETIKHAWFAEMWLKSAGEVKAR